MPRCAGAALRVKSCATNISAKVRDGALSPKIDHPTYETQPGVAGAVLQTPLTFIH